MLTKLLIISLLAGLIQSFLELKKDEIIIFKLSINKALSLLYILCCIIGIIVIILQKEEDKGLNDIINSINSKSTLQLDKLTEAIHRTDTLLIISDSLNNKMDSILYVRDSLLNQFKTLNTKFSKQIDIDNKMLIERAPVISMVDSDIHWEGSDSTSWLITVVLRNFGKRNAIITRFDGFALFYDNKKQLLLDLDFPETNPNQIILPIDIGDYKSLYNSLGIKKDFKSIVTPVDYIIICIKINYYDILTEIPQEKLFFKVWLPDHDFGEAKDWQVNFLRKWSIEKNKFK